MRACPLYTVSRTTVFKVKALAKVGETLNDKPRSGRPVVTVDTNRTRRAWKVANESDPTTPMRSHAKDMGVDEKTVRNMVADLSGKSRLSVRMIP